MGYVVQRSAEDDRRNNEQPAETQEEVQMPLDQSTVSGSRRLCLFMFMNERVQYLLLCVYVCQEGCALRSHPDIRYSGTDNSLIHRP